jgi:BirA family biotin operon repressor/biotin-[acetyl-CoA-carboxylase] ligase
MQKKFNPKLAQLVAVMSDGEFHDGTALGEVLNMTRSAVWKMIKKLERYDIEINSVKGKGYALCEPLILLDDNVIRKCLDDKKIQLTVFESIDSTNEYLKSHRFNSGVHFCTTEFQEHGRGRLNREWRSPFGKNLTLSCLYPFQKDISELAGLSLVVSLAVVKTLQQFGLQDDVKVKWPNDVLCQSKKISGTLIELQAESHGMCHAVIGVGLNVNMLIDERRQISQEWNSMRRVGGVYFDRNLVCAALMNHLLDYLRRFDRDGFEFFIDEWVAAEGMHGKQVSLKSPRETVTGEAVGINAQGHLLLKMDDGQVRAFSSGDTSIVKKS